MDVSEGRGAAQDYLQAYKWLNKAATAGDVGARIKRRELMKQMTRRQIDEALML